MPIWFRRFRMVFDLRHQAVPQAALPTGYSLLPWEEQLLDAHASVKYQSFVEAADTAVFPSLGDEEGCLRLMRDITERPGFLPESCWLLVFREGASGRQYPCGTIQGLQTEPDTGAIQNVGIIPGHRGRGAGQRMIAASLTGFRNHGMRFVTLEVTARNPGAVRLYSRMGFQIRHVVYKPGNFAVLE